MGEEEVKQTLRLGVFLQISSAERAHACKLGRKLPQVHLFLISFLYFFCAARAGQTCMQITAVVRIRLRHSASLPALLIANSGENTQT